MPFLRINGSRVVLRLLGFNFNLRLDNGVVIVVDVVVVFALVIVVVVVVYCIRIYWKQGEAMQPGKTEIEILNMINIRKLERSEYPASLDIRPTPKPLDTKIMQ